VEEVVEKGAHGEKEDSTREAVGDRLCGDVVDEYGWNY
jgi:hypothetical protein